MAPHSARWDEEKIFPGRRDAPGRRSSASAASMWARRSAARPCRGSTPRIIFEELAYGDVTTAAFLSIHNMVAGMIDRFGSDALRQRLLPGL